MKKFIIERCGIEAKNLIATGRQHQQQSAPVPESQPNRLLSRYTTFSAIQPIESCWSRTC